MAGIIDRLTDRVSKEWHVIAQAKFVFGLATALVVCVTAIAVWVIANLFYSERIAVLQSTVDYEKTQNNDLHLRIQNVPQPASLPHSQVIPLGVRFHFAS